MPFLTSGGIKLHYGDIGHGPAVLLVHGYTGVSWNWALNVPDLASEYRCIAIDLPGHGPSDKPRDPAFFELPHMAEVVFGSLRALGIDKCFLVGHSMGGMIAEHIALEHQESLFGLGLISTSAEAVEIGASAAPEVVRAAREKGIEAAFKARVAMVPTGDERRRFVQYRSGAFLSMTADGLLACADAMANRVSVVERLTKIRLPTLIVCGSEDAPFLPQAMLMHKLIPDSDIHILQGIGHNVPADAPDAFNATLLEFLAAHRP